MGSLWQGLLKRLEQSSLLSQLEFVLLELNHQPHLWNVKSFVDAWNFCLLKPLEKCSSGATPESRRICEKSLKLLSRCPLVGDLAVKELWGEIRRLGFPDLADLEIKHLLKD